MWIRKIIVSLNVLFRINFHSCHFNLLSDLNYKTNIFYCVNIKITWRNFKICLPKQAQDKGNHPSKSASFKTRGGHHFRLACRTFSADRMFSELLSCNHDSWLGDYGHAGLPGRHRLISGLVSSYCER